jgi:hypothetical protein
MSPEETQLLNALFDRVKTASNTPRDPDAEALIARAVREQPAATYYLAQAVIVQEKGLEAAGAHIKQLEERVHQLEAGNTDPHHTAQGGFLSSIFGSSQPQAPAPAPQPVYRNDTSGETAGPWGRAPSAQQYAPQQAPSQPYGTQQSFAPSGGSSFLHGALGTAAGVAGGMLLANSLSGIFSGGHMSSLGLGSPFGGSAAGNAPIEETVINNNYYGNDPPQQDDDDIQQADYTDDDTGADDFSGDDTTDV